jgi:hypothetical protein
MFSKVTPGSPLRIPAATWNILTDVAKQHKPFAAMSAGERKGGGAADTPKHPWKVTSASSTSVKVSVGTIGGIVPSNIFSELTIAGTGTEYVIVTATMTSNAPTSALLSIQTTAPTPSLTNESAPPAEVHDVLAVLLDGQIFQVRSRNLNVESQLVFEAPVTEPQIGEPNTTPWYRWAVTEGW